MSKKQTSGSGCGCLLFIILLGGATYALYKLGPGVILIAVICVILVVAYIVMTMFTSSSTNKKQIIVKAGDIYTPEQFINKETLANYPGVYILHNATKNMNYVGQAQIVSERVTKHFTGRGGNPDVFFDYRSGDNFAVKVIPLKDSGFDSLNQLEKAMIEHYNAHENGYNKTRGNN